MIKFTSVEEEAPPLEKGDGETKDNLYELAKTLQVSLESERDLIVLGGASGNELGMSASNSQDLLSTASPIFGYNTFELNEENVNSISSPDNDEEEEDYGLDQSLTEDFRHGITNINYDFDVSDQSAENSVAVDQLIGGAAPQDSHSGRMLIEDSPKDVLLPTPLLPVALPQPATDTRSQAVEPENLFIHK